MAIQMAWETVTVSRVFYPFGYLFYKKDAFIDWPRNMTPHVKLSAAASKTCINNRNHLLNIKENSVF